MSKEHPANEWESTGDILLYTHMNTRLVELWTSEGKFAFAGHVVLDQTLKSIEHVEN